MFKILNLATGTCYNGVISKQEYNFPELIFPTKKDAERQLYIIIEAQSVVRDIVIRREQFEIIEVYV
jgi:hypothetical protein